MGDSTTCEHDFHWFADPANERGWRCVACEHKPGEPPGFSPAHDRSHVERKVRHATFWREISEGILAGKDPRDRCACGALSSITTWKDRNRVVACSHEHLQVALGRDPTEPF